jgi:CheY-like chemotaxis protein
MLVDDDQNDNYFHSREIKKTNLAIVILTKNSGMEALEYLKSKNDTNNIQPELIFLDINMPQMNGWEFLQEYNRLDKELQSGKIIMMLTSSKNPDEVRRAMTFSVVSDYISKPLTKEILEDIIKNYFREL